MADLDARIRADLDYRRGKLVGPDDPFAEMAFDGMRDALLAVLDATDLETYPPNYCECGKCLKRWLRELIADALGVDGAQEPDATVQAAYDIDASRHDERHTTGLEA